MTDQITFDDEPDEPPSILDAPTGIRIGKIIWVKKDQTSFDMKAVVHDANVFQELPAHWRLATPRDKNKPYEEGVVQISGDENREFGFTVHTENLIDKSCHQLELVVSAGLLESRVGDPEPALFEIVRPANSPIASASWWVWEGDGMNIDDAARLLASCDAEIAPGSPTGAEELMP